MLSAFEFSRHYHMQKARHPLSERGHNIHQEDEEAFHAALTDSGINKVSKGIKNLAPNLDYQIREGGGADWLPLGRGEFTQPYRHDWVMVVRKRPEVPVLYGAQGSRTKDEQAMKLLVLFFPWVNDITEASHHVPFIGNFWMSGMKSWREALRARVIRSGFATEEAKRNVLNFCFVYCLPRSMQLQEGLAENSDNEGIEDEPVAFDEEDLLAATLTHVKGRGKRQDEEEEEAQGTGAQLEQEGGNAKLYDLTMEMLHISDKIWVSNAKDADRGDLAMQQIHQAMLEAKSVQDHIQAKKAALASRNKVPASSASGKRGQLIVGEPSVKQQEPVTVDKLRQWLESDRVRRGTNAKQHEFLELVVDRILAEVGLLPPEESSRQTSDPLFWLLHGPPGTGKSHVLGFVRELFGLIGYVYGLDYEFVAYQAANASDLQGKTIHQAFGFDISVSAGKPVSEEKAKCMANWRWLIMDEISLTDAKLFGKCEQRLQAVMPNANQWKRDGAGRIRPFAHVNVILTGDFHQLPPPAGHYLADVPRSLQDPNCEKKPDGVFADHGKQLLWGGAVQGVTELEEGERCKDEWWNQVVDEMRAGCLSETTHKYLHGMPVDGCTLSEEEKASRQRVITSVEDLRLKQDKFKEAVAIVANNDARYQINKDRARCYSKAAGTPLYWATAHDKASPAAVQAESCDKQAKIRPSLEQWLGKTNK